jgi:hypothetical protein
VDGTLLSASLLLVTNLRGGTALLDRVYPISEKLYPLLSECWPTISVARQPLSLNIRAAYSPRSLVGEFFASQFPIPEKSNRFPAIRSRFQEFQDAEVAVTVERSRSVCGLWHTSAIAASTSAGRTAATAGDNSVPHSVLAGCTPSSTTSGVRFARIRSATSRSATPSWCTLPLPGKVCSSGLDIRTSVPGAARHPPHPAPAGRNSPRCR